MTESPPSVGHFGTTRWTLVDLVRSGEPEVATQALEELCKAYWPPVFAYLRKQGHSLHDAQDLTQEFFFRKVVRGKLFGKASKDRGKLRTLLLAALANYVKGEWRSGHSARRGGWAIHISMEELPDSVGLAESHDPATPELLYHRRWAHRLLEMAMEKLEAEQVCRGKGAMFAQLKPWLHWDRSRRAQESYMAVAAALGVSAGSLRVAVCRLRSRLNELVRTEVARTLDNPSKHAIKEELMDLMRNL